LGTIFDALNKSLQNVENDLNSSNSFKTPTLFNSNRKNKSYIIESRRSIRKETFFHGNVVETQTKGYVTQTSRKSKIIVINLSMHGIRIKTLGKSSAKEGKKIEIEFKLDDSRKSKIVREVRIIQLISPVDIGCEFLSTEHYGYLNQYFLSHF